MLGPRMRSPYQLSMKQYLRIKTRTFIPLISNSDYVKTRTFIPLISDSDYVNKNKNIYTVDIRFRLRE